MSRPCRQLRKFGGGLFDLAQGQPVCRHAQMQGAVKAKRSEFLLRHISFCDHKLLSTSVLLVRASSLHSRRGTILNQYSPFADDLTIGLYPTEVARIAAVVGFSRIELWSNELPSGGTKGKKSKGQTSGGQVHRCAADWSESLGTIGNSSQNRLPSPGCDSTPTQPPMRSAPLRTMASPTPVPEYFSRVCSR